MDVLVKELATIDDTKIVDGLVDVLREKLHDRDRRTPISDSNAPPNQESDDEM